MKKVVLFVDNFYPKKDNSINVVDKYARNLRENKIKVLVVAPKVLDKNGNPKFDDSELPYKVLRCKVAADEIAGYSHSLPNQDEELLMELDSFVKTADVIHIHTPLWLGRLGVEFAKAHGKPCIGTFHKDYKSDFDYYFGKDSEESKKYLNYILKTYQMCDEVWAINKSCAEILYSYGYNRNKDVFYIQNGTEMMTVSDDIRRISNVMINRTFELSPGDNVIVYATKLIKQKNVDFIFDVMKELKNREVLFKFLLVGDGPQKENLEKYIIDNELQNNIVMVGEVTDRKYLQNIMARADLSVFPSINDISTVLPVEFASVSVPTLFIKGSPASSNYTDGVDSFVELGLVKEFANKIETLITEEGKRTLKKVGRTAREEIYKTWSDLVRNIVIKRYEEKIIAKKKAIKFSI